MNLSQILIEAGVMPDDLYPDCKFIAQDGDDGLLAEYQEFPDRSILSKVWTSSYMCECQFLPHKSPIANDWKIPLSREKFIADYAAHVA